MKIFFLNLCFLICCQSFSQTSTASIGDDFKLMSSYSGGNANGYSVIPTYKSNNIEGSPFFSPNWMPGSVTTKDSKVFSSQLLFMFDEFDNSLYYKKNDTGATMKIDLNQVSSFTLNSDKPHLFMPADFFSKDYTGQFFEVLVFNNKYSLLKLSQITLQKPAYSEINQVVNNEQSSKFVTKVSYFIYTNGVLQPAELKKKSFPKALNGSDVDKAEAYIKNNSGNFNETYVTNMIDEINKPGQ